MKASDPLLLGVDFTSRPTARKPITVALGRRRQQVVQVDELRSFSSFDPFLAWLSEDAHWVGGFDFPFGLPREFVEDQGWPRDWLPLMQQFAATPREALKQTFAGYCAGRPVGGKFAHRAVDLLAGSSPSMKWVNPPVAWMMHAGVPLLLQAGVHLPGLHDGDERRVALEAYPGQLAREVIGRRSYKADETARQTAERLIARKDLVERLEQGQTRLGLRLRLSHAMREALVADASGDRLDAVLCLLQAAWGQMQDRHGLPDGVDPIEGWIVGTPLPSRTS